ncbi:hypothetical protein E7Y31_05830 [Candidatus Frankia alpina]|uniref:Uncharacterized protein n=1 Tax=Candidatus Frankia alpina TaxID=2699483 RepID=A0A4S5ESG8_9ACTN|nr:hypothetical protein E7Y31_05830 [Candidatus Frankia alpina]
MRGCVCQAGAGQEHRAGCPADNPTGAGWTPETISPTQAGETGTSTELLPAPELLPVRVRAARVWDVAVGQTPSPWSQAQPPMADLVRYAQQAPWCAEDAESWRRAGRVYQWTLSIPVSLVCYLLAWVVQRPARLGLAGLLVGLVVLAVAR